MTENGDEAADRDSDRQGYSVARHILELADTVPSVQTLLDQQHTQDLAALDALAKNVGIGPDNDLFLSLMPPELVLSKYEVDANFLFSSEHRSELEVGVRLSGRLVHSFLELRYHSSEAQRDRLKITVETSPVSHRNPTLENHRG